MSQPKRYKFAAYIYDGKATLSMMDTDGKNSFVHFSDYSALAAENSDNLKTMASLHMEFRALAAENERLRKDYESILNDRNLLWRDYKDSQQAYQRLHHSFMCLKDAAKKGRDAK